MAKSRKDPYHTMPLKCLSPHGEEYAFRHTGESWAELKAANAAKQHLKMSCCGGRAVLKRSNRGTQFFAHARRGPCTTAPESVQHLLAKDIIARSAEAMGWVANSEQRGKTPHGKDWIADVFCRNPSVNNAVAFEVQWSPQDSEETQLRQATYKESGVRGLWLMRQARIPISQQTPAFQLSIENTMEAPLVRLPSGTYMEILINRNTAANPGNWSQCIPLDEFVRGALTKRLIFAPALNATVPIRVHAAESGCWKCTKPTTCLIHIELAVDEVFPCHGNLSITLSEIESAAPHGESWLAKYVPNDLLASVGIGPVKLRHSRTAGYTYLSNGCVHCDALQGAFFEHDISWEAKPVLTSHAKLEAWIATTENGDSFVNRWWFDRAHVT
jgi:hypothetical protein